MNRLTRISRIARLPRVQCISRANSSFSRPSPPKLPAAEQAEFERLQREAAVSPAFQETAVEADAQSSSTEQTTDKKEDPMEGALYRGAPPEFQGEKNPKTGEVGGPKNEPLRWGGQSDWSYNGKVTDF